MFDDNTKHKITTIQHEGRPYIERSLKKENPELLLKEYGIQEKLTLIGICPNVYELTPTYYLEEIINSKSLCLTNRNIQKIAKTLKLLHEFDTKLLPKSLQNSLNNKFIDKFIGNLDYLRLYKTMMSGLPTDIFDQKLEVKIQSFINLFKNRALQKYSVIHGDLNKSNILLTKTGDIKLIDWSDSRIDEPEADIAQLFYHFSFTLKQKKLFLKAYANDTVDNAVLQLRFLLLLIYDLVYSWKMQKKIETSIIERISDIIHHKRI